MIIGIAGGTGSGKTTVVKKIMAHFKDEGVSLISQDNYYRDNGHLSIEEKKAINFDHPESLEFELLTQHIQMLKSGRTIAQPLYDYTTCSRLNKVKSINSNKVILVEGILIFTCKELRDLLDIKIFVEAPDDERLIRVIERDIRERNRDVTEVLSRYLHTVKPMHDLFIEPSKKFADIILPIGGNNKVAIKMIIDLIDTKIQKSLQS
ncbi:MAG: uridine kinase [Chitinophagales bacterium]|jgi:uridine kinase|nr:uridine kinase [Chitinophagales bacterium]